MVDDKGWKLNDKIKTNNLEKLSSFIKQNRIMFKYCGGDMETFLQNVKMLIVLEYLENILKQKKSSPWKI